MNTKQMITEAAALLGKLPLAEQRREIILESDGAAMHLDELTREELASIILRYTDGDDLYSHFSES
jgi:hypothetical protein